MLERRRLSIGWAWLLLLTACASKPPPPSKSSPLLGELMPPFEAQTVSGNPVISGGYEGHTVVLTFVSAACEPCERVLAAAQDMYADQRELVVLGIFRKDESDAAARAIAARMQLRFPIVVDRDGVLANKFNVEALPSVVVVDSARRVRWIGGTDMTQEGLLAAVDSAD